MAQNHGYFVAAYVIVAVVYVAYAISLAVRLRKAREHAGDRAKP